MQLKNKILMYEIKSSLKIYAKEFSLHLNLSIHFQFQSFCFSFAIRLEIFLSYYTQSHCTLKHNFSSKLYHDNLLTIDQSGTGRPAE